MKKALLIGITNYKDLPPLEGCLNDVRLMYKILKDVYKFTDFKILDNEVATRRNIMKGFQWLFSDLSPGDIVFCFYSGHGTQMMCTKETLCWENDGFDECLVPYDMSWDDPIRDDDIAYFIEKVDRGVKIIFCCDSCFSGTILKNPLPPKTKNKYVSPPLHIELAGDVDLDEELNVDTSKDKVGKMARYPFLISHGLQENTVLISACSDKQMAADMYINGRYHGALTFFIAQTLKENGWKMPYRKLLEIVNQKLDAQEYTQDAQLEAREELKDQNFLE